MALTSTGLSIKRLPTIISELQEALKLELGADVDVSSDSLLGIINSIYAASSSDLWSLAQAVYDAFNIDTAEGKQLDDLVALVGLTRLSESPTNGLIEFTGVPSTIITAGKVFADNQGNTYSNPASITLSIVSCTEAIIEVNTVADVTDYQVVVDGDVYIYTSGVSATAISIVAGLLALIGVQATYTATSSTDGTSLIITSNTLLDTIPINLSSNLSATSVTSVGTVENNIDGAIPSLPNTITLINTPVSGLEEVNNPVALTLGRVAETDVELRIRQKDSVQIAGTATVPAIEASLNQIQGVTQAFIIENRTFLTDGEGRPPKSYEPVVEGGSDQDIADTVWETKPTGVETYGTTTVVIVDGQGNNQSVNFSRPEVQYLWIDITYSKYDEESFPADGESAMSEEAVDFGNSLDLGEDVIPKRFYGSIYSGVTGIEDLIVKVASSGTDPNTQPSSPSFVETAVPIAGAQVAKFDVSRVAITLV